MDFTSPLEIKSAQSFSEIKKVISLIEMGLSPALAKSFIPNLDKTLILLRLNHLSKNTSITKSTRPHAITWLKKTPNQYAFNIAYEFYLRFRGDNPDIKKAITATDLYNSYKTFITLFPELEFNNSTENGVNLDRFLRGLYAIRHEEVDNSTCLKCEGSFLKYALQSSPKCPHCTLLARKNTKLKVIAD